MDTNTYSSPPSIKFYPFPSHYFTPSSAVYPCKSIFSFISDIVITNTSLFKAYRGYRFWLKEPSSGHRNNEMKTPYVLESGRSSTFYNSECSEYIKMYVIYKWVA